MAKLLFQLNNVPDEEADAVRQLLDDNDFQCYETSAGRWGISVAAIWIIDESEFDAARQLINEYQQSLGLTPQQPLTFAEKFRERPVDVVLAFVAISIVLGLTLWPFVTAFE